MRISRFISILLLFCLLSAGLHGEEKELAATQYSRQENLRIRCSSSRDLPVLYQISTICSAEVRKWLRCYNQRPKSRIDLYFCKDDDSNGFNPLSRRIRIDPSAPPELIYHRLLTAMTGRYILNHCQGKDRNLECLAWIAAGLYHRIYYDGKGFTLRYTPDFRIAREQFENGFYPSLELLLTHPVPPEKTELYRLYSLYCDVFLSVLERQNPKTQELMKKFLELQSFNRPQLSSLQFLIQGKNDSSEEFSVWYREQMYKAAGEGIRKAQAEDIASRLQDIITMPYISQDRPGEISHRPLYRIPAKKLTEKFLRERRIALARLHLRAPMLLQPSIYLFIQALQCRTVLGMGSRYRKAEEAFSQAYRRQCTAEAMLDRQEKNAGGKMGAFVNDWKIIRHYQQLRNELFSAALRKKPETENQSSR